MSKPKRKIFSVVASPEITNRGHGIRRRAGLVFGRRAIYLEALPQAVARDRHLKIRTVSPETMEQRGGTLHPRQGVEMSDQCFIAPIAVTVKSGQKSVTLDPGGPGEFTLDLSKDPIYLRHVPPAIASDKQIQVQEVTFSDIVDAGGRFTLLPGEAPPEPMAIDPDEVKIDELRQIAATHGLDSEGDRDELLARIHSYFRAHGVVFLKAERVQ